MASEPRRALAPDDLPVDLRGQFPARLAAGAIGSAVVFLVALGVEPLRPEGASSALSAGMAALGAVLSLGVAWIARTRRLGARALTDLAVVFEVGVGTVVWAMELAAPFATTTHTPGIPTAAGWLLFFPLLIPLPARAASLAALLVTLAGPLVLMAYLAAGQPTPAVTHVGLWFGAAAVSGVVAVAASRVAHRAVLSLTAAREADQYEMLERIGRGGMGEVWVGRHRRLARLAAIKTIRLDRLARFHGPDGRALAEARFEREARIIAGLRSPHTVELYDYGRTEDGAVYFAMELLRGLDLQQLVERFGPQSPARVVHVLLGAAESLAEAHAQGLVHRDIKPSNLMLATLGVTVDVVKVLDFGTAKAAQEAIPGIATQAGQFVGTPAYAAPEAVAGMVEPRSDLYALGCVAWWLLTGTLVFDGETPADQLRAHLGATPRDLAEEVPWPLPDGLAALVRALLSKRPGDRPASAVALAAALRALPVQPWTQGEARAWWTAHAPETLDPSDGSTSPPPPATAADASSATFVGDGDDSWLRDAR